MGQLKVPQSGTTEGTSEYIFVNLRYLGAELSMKGRGGGHPGFAVQIRQLKVHKFVNLRYLRVGESVESRRGSHVQELLHDHVMSRVRQLAVLGVQFRRCLRPWAS